MCVGTRVAVVRRVEPLETDDAKQEEGQPAASTFPLTVVAIAGVIAGMAGVLAVVGSRTDASAPAAQAAAAPVAPPPAVEEGPAPTWTGSRRASWASDGSKTISFTLAATHDLPVWMNRVRPALIVRCLYRTTEAFVVLDTSTTFEEDANSRTVRIQWDDDPESTERWTVSESAKELFAPDGVAFVKRLADAKRLRFGFSPFNAQPVTAEFVVEGFDKLAGLVSSTCGWRFDGRSSS
jgi:hypothetical protein